MYVSRIGYKKKTKPVPRLWVSSTFVALCCLEFVFPPFFFACFILQIANELLLRLCVCLFVCCAVSARTPLYSELHSVEYKQKQSGLWAPGITTGFASLFSHFWRRSGGRFLINWMRCAPGSRLHSFWGRTSLDSLFSFSILLYKYRVCVCVFTHILHYRVYSAYRCVYKHTLCCS